jgi:hypothetical protein
MVKSSIVALMAKGKSHEETKGKAKPEAGIDAIDDR